MASGLGAVDIQGCSGPSKIRVKIRDGFHNSVIAIETVANLGKDAKGRWESSEPGVR